jgi:PPP family 3-phenylpropionic acid transporter
MALGVSGLYLALYLHYGFFAFLPLWLRELGAGSGEIGVLMAIPLGVRLITVAPFCAWAGRRGRVRDAIAATALISAALIVLLLGHPGHAARIALVLIFSIVWDQTPVLTDAYAMMAVRKHGLNFGRIRVWGSIAVVASNAAAGWTLGVIGIAMLPAIVAALLLIPAVFAPTLPKDTDLTSTEPPSHRGWRDVVADRSLVKAMVAASLIMGSHGVLTTFGAIQWAAQGLSTGTIGLLQAQAVAMEIIAFWFGAKVLGARDPRVLLCAAAAAAVLRWLVMATTPALPLLVAAQMLQGITATGAILGVMLVIAQRVPAALSGAAQGLNAVLFGVVLALTMACSGPLWDLGPVIAFGTMAALGLLALVAAWPVRGSITEHTLGPALHR